MFSYNVSQITYNVDNLECNAFLYTFYSKNIAIWVSEWVSNRQVRSHLSSDVMSKQNRFSIESDILRVHDARIIVSAEFCKRNVSMRHKSIL
jgi:hypothetical protein